MNVLRTLLPVALLLCSIASHGQQLSLFTQYRENAVIINPAAMESDFLTFGNNMTFGASYRAQWTGIKSAPRTQTLRMSFVNKRYAGVTPMFGGHIVNDQTGPTGFTGIYGRIGGVITGDAEYGGLALALTAGAVQYRVKASELVLRDDGDVLGSADQTRIFPDVGLGLYYYQMVGDGNFFYTGLSMPQALGLDLTFKNENGQFFTKRVQHIYGSIGFYKFVGDDGFIEPSVLFKYAPNAPINVDVNLRYQIPGSLWVGAGASSAKAVHLETGFLLGQNLGFDNIFRIGYGFDYSFSSFGPSIGATHEINLTLSLDR
ncbi:MAG TPA: PorP/SprF family type IX secretion system membrane protein [Saprospiraceae bacterium]|nr:PorP/SprF family type IX secretion system membrane protein [Saprospiraceae bacterium]HRK79884.1 PorP/SprF family type IX secretion system membrane protein [Saprospiraceae bacterium]